MSDQPLGRRTVVGGALAGSTLAPVSTIPANAASGSSPKGTVKAFYDSYRLRDLQASWDRYIHPDAVMHVPGFDRQSWLEMDSKIVAAFGDLAITVLDQLAEDDKVATRWVLGGHHTGQFLDIPPSGVYASFTATTVDRVKNHKIIDHWSDADFTAFLKKLAA
ncbi:ester cyclase [Streptomyces noursei]|uniref:ester cyclase n=1 Tax=Streptomyces noursei TaxID=1971 RepID=UPI0023B83658|nr:ester cyclase [Streptomyces noursei]